jgi:hypothetical protein
MVRWLIRQPALCGTVRAFDTIENNFDYWHDAAVARGQSEFALPQLLVQAQDAKALQ